MTHFHESPTYPVLLSILYSKQSMSRCRHDIFIQNLTLKAFLMPDYPLVLKPILYSAIPMLDTHIHTAFGVLETVIDPGSLFANHAI